MERLWRSPHRAEFLLLSIMVPLHGAHQLTDARLYVQDGICARPTSQMPTMSYANSTATNSSLDQRDASDVADGHSDEAHRDV